MVPSSTVTPHTRATIRQLDQTGHIMRIQRSTPLNIIPTRLWTNVHLYGEIPLMLSQPQSRRFTIISETQDRILLTNYLRALHLTEMLAMRSSGRASFMHPERSNDY